MRIFVVGLGSAGRRHLANARALGHQAKGGRLDAAAAFSPDCLVVASPTSAHLEALRWAVDNGVHAYVEKPLSTSTDGVAEALAAADAAGLTVAVGYNFRFHPAVEAIRTAVEAGRIGRLLSIRAEVGQYLPEWHPEEDYRRSYAARADLGGGVLLTLSHELDYVRWVAGEVSEVQGIAARLSSLELDVDDVAEVICRHAAGTVASIHMDFVDRAYSRRSRWVGDLGTFAWDWGGPVRALPSGEALWEDAGFDLGSTYVSALHDFVDAVEAGRDPRCTGWDGLRTLELCESIQDAR
jgi:predicted dehydrogenase